MLRRLVTRSSSRLATIRRETPQFSVYGHYDVQPAEPLAEWRSPPFEPVVCGDDVYGRGASDNKGQMLAHVKALESFLKTAGALPVNVICLFEGEEEIGSPNLTTFLAANRDDLAADCAVVSDTQIPASNRPAIIYGLRGGLSVELEAQGRGGNCIRAFLAGQFTILCRRCAK